MTDYSLLPMLQRRMAEATARREPFPSEEGALIRRLAATRENLRRCLGAMPAEVVSPQVRAEARLVLADTEVIQERIVYRTEADVWVPAHVYRPAWCQDEPLPGVLLIQGWDLDKHSLPEFKIRLAQAGSSGKWGRLRDPGRRRPVRP